MQTSFAADSIGVGLNLAMELVKTHHGSLTFEENRPKGSVFTVTLPTDKSVYAAGDFLITAPEKEPEKTTPPMRKTGICLKIWRINCQACPPAPYLWWRMMSTYATFCRTHSPTISGQTAHLTGRAA